MKKDGLDAVRLQDVRVTHWIRGTESLDLVTPVAERLPMLGLGGAVATPPGGITAEVLAVRSFDDRKSREHVLTGKIVLFNVPFRGYRETVTYRATSRPSRHARVRSPRSSAPSG